MFVELSRPDQHRPSSYPVLCEAHPLCSHAGLQHRTGHLKVVGSDGHHDFCCIRCSRVRTSQCSQVLLNHLGEVKDITGGEEVRASLLHLLQNSLGKLLQQGQVSVPGAVTTHLRKRWINTNAKTKFKYGQNTNSLSTHLLIRLTFPEHTVFTRIITQLVST